MTVLPKILAGVAGLALFGAAAPAAAQSYPYGNYGGYNQGSGVVGAIIQSVLGGGQYGGYGRGQYGYGQGNDRVAVSQCARAAEMRVNRNGGGYGGYNQGYDPRYGNQGYGYDQGGSARVVGITRVERRSNGLKVAGVMSSGMGYGGGYNQGYDPRYGQQGYDPRYGNQGYGNQGYGNHAQQADLRFNCRVDYRGRVTDLNIARANVRRGY